MASKRRRPAEAWDSDRKEIADRHRQERDELNAQWRAQRNAMEARHCVELRTHDAAAAADKEATTSDRKRARRRDRVGTACCVCKQPVVEDHFEACDGCDTVRCTFDDDEVLSPALAKLWAAHVAAEARRLLMCQELCHFYNGTADSCRRGDRCPFRHTHLDVPYEADPMTRYQLQQSVQSWPTSECCGKTYCEGVKCDYDKCWTCYDISGEIRCCKLKDGGLLLSQCLDCAEAVAENRRDEEREEARHEDRRHYYDSAYPR